MTEPSDEIMARAREACKPDRMCNFVGDEIHVLNVARAITEAIAAEREECAKVAERWDLQDGIDNGAAATRAARYAVIAIRKRGEAEHYPVMKPYVKPDSFTVEECKEAIRKVTRKD